MCLFIDYYHCLLFSNSSLKVACLYFLVFPFNFLISPKFDLDKNINFNSAQVKRLFIAYRYTEHLKLHSRKPREKFVSSRRLFHPRKSNPEIHSPREPRLEDRRSAEPSLLLRLDFPVLLRLFSARESYHSRGSSPTDLVPPKRGEYLSRETPSRRPRKGEEKSLAPRGSPRKDIELLGGKPVTKSRLKFVVYLLEAAGRAVYLRGVRKERMQRGGRWADVLNSGDLKKL